MTINIYEAKTVAEEGREELVKAINSLAEGMRQMNAQMMALAEKVEKLENAADPV